MTPEQQRLLNKAEKTLQSAVIAAFGQRFARPERVPVYFHRYLIKV